MSARRSRQLPMERRLLLRAIGLAAPYGPTGREGSGAERWVCWVVGGSWIGTAVGMRPRYVDKYCVPGMIGTDYEIQWQDRGHVARASRNDLQARRAMGAADPLPRIE